jgi:hypothetical protein
LDRFQKVVQKYGETGWIIHASGSFGIDRFIEGTNAVRIGALCSGIPEDNALAKRLGLESIVRLSSPVTLSKDVPAGTKIGYEQTHCLEKRDYNNVLMRRTQKSFKFLLEGTVLPYRFPLGKARVIEGASSENIRHFYEKWYDPEKMFFVAVGNIDIAKFEERIRNTFQDLKSKTPPHFELDQLKVQRRNFFHFSDPDPSETSIEISLLFPDRFVSDTYEARRHRMILDIILNVLKERLLDKQSANPSLFAHVDAAFVQNFLKTKQSAFCAEMTCEYKNWAACLNLLEQEMRKMHQYGISEAELQRQKELFINAAERDVLAAKTRHSSGLVSQLVHCHQEKLYFLSPENYCELIKRLNAELTAEDCLKELEKKIGKIYTLPSVPTSPLMVQNKPSRKYSTDRSKCQ